MSYRFENNAIVFDGWEKGIADSPFDGIADMRNVNILSVPGQAMVQHKLSATTIPALITSRAFTVVAATNVFTYSGTPAVHNGLAVSVANLVDVTGISVSTVYYVGDATATTFKLYRDPYLQSVMDITADGSGDFTAYPLGKPSLWTEFRNPASFANNWLFFVDENGRSWAINKEAITNGSNTVAAGTVSFLGNLTLTGAAGQGIVAWLPNGSSTPYLFVFRGAKIDYFNILSCLAQTGVAPATAWTYDWKSVTSSSTVASHQAIVGSDDVVYYCDYYGLGSISQNVDQTFDPGTAATYTHNTLALDIPGTDFSKWVAELGTDLLIGGLRNLIYPWDRISPSFRKPLILPEYNTTRIIGTNSNAYIFAGTKGRIYITNGAAVELYKQIPHSLIGYPEPQIVWGDADYWNNQLYFSFTAQQNDGTAISDFRGVWAIDLTTGALRYEYQPSSGNYTSTVSMIAHNRRGTAVNGGTLASGAGLYVGWDNSSTYGIDQTSSTPYSGGEAYIDLDIVPMGTFLSKGTPTGFEFKLTRKLNANESVELLYRTNLEDSYTSIVTWADDDDLSNTYDATFENAEWLQFRVKLTSASSSQTYVPLREIRMLL